MKKEKKEKAEREADDEGETVSRAGS